MTRRGWLLLLALGATWGAAYPLTKLALADFDPPMVVFTRVASAALVLVPLGLRGRVLHTLRSKPGTVLIAALIQGTIPLVLLTVGQQHVSSSLAGVIVAAQPVFVAILTVWLDPLDRPDRRGLAGAALGLVGVGLLFGLDLGGRSTTLLYGAVILAAALSFAVGAVVIHRWLTKAAPLAVATATMTVTSIAILPFAMLPTPATHIRHGPDLVTALVILCLGTVGTGLALVLFYRLILDLGPGRASLAWYIAPAFAVLFGLFLGEPLTTGKLSGLALILLGSVLASRRVPRPSSLGESGRAIAPQGGEASSMSS
ncbi:MAG TPA: DMT family transporter [Actinomycetota bacterium]|nr:DMT family transporter [Actinomycetota bacterium]